MFSTAVVIGALRVNAGEIITLVLISLIKLIGAYLMNKWLANNGGNHSSVTILSRIVRNCTFMTCAPNKDSNQYTHPHSLTRVFVGCMKKLCILGYPKCAQCRFLSDSANAQADLNLRWVHISEGTLSDVAAHLYFRQVNMGTNFVLLNVTAGETVWPEYLGDSDSARIYGDGVTTFTGFLLHEF